MTSPSPSDGDASDDDADWRAFRARLVRSEKKDDDDPTAETPSWAYDAGGLVERGSVILSVASSDPLADDADALTNQCYRKSAVLVLEVKSDFISGIVLNRPTNIDIVGERRLVRRAGDSAATATNEESSDHRWKIWFGGEVGGPYSEDPQMMCLHSVDTELAKEVSDVIIPGVLITSHEGARALVDKGEARPSDFWLFCGICGWETESFQREMRREKMWNVVSSDGRTIFRELDRLRCDDEDEMDRACDVDSDPRNAGLHTWEMLMDLVGRGDEARRGRSDNRESFGDLMLREWATGVLSFDAGGERGVDPRKRPRRERPFPPPPFTAVADGDDFDISTYDPASGMSDTEMAIPASPTRQPQDNGTASKESIERSGDGDGSTVGKFVCASSAPCSPFLLSDQVFHRSTVLILRDDETCSEGVVLNHVTKDTIQLDTSDEKEGGAGVVDLRVRYGGPFLSASDVEKGAKLPSTIYLHYDDDLRKAGVGSPVGASGVCLCTEDEVRCCLRRKACSPSRFMVVRGIANWEKAGGNAAGTSNIDGGGKGGEEIGGVRGDVEEGFFEIVTNEDDCKAAWDLLLKQELLSSQTIDRNVATSLKAWKLAGRRSDDGDDDTSPFVFGSDVQVLDLATEALRRWVAVFLLGEAVDASSSIF